MMYLPTYMPRIFHCGGLAVFYFSLTNKQLWVDYNLAWFWMNIYSNALASRSSIKCSGGYILLIVLKKNDWSIGLLDWRLIFSVLFAKFASAIIIFYPYLIMISRINNFLYVNKFQFDSMLETSSFTVYHEDYCSEYRLKIVFSPSWEVDCSSVCASWLKNAIS